MSNKFTERDNFSVMLEKHLQLSKISFYSIMGISSGKICDAKCALKFNFNGFLGPSEAREYLSINSFVTEAVTVFFFAY